MIRSVVAILLLLPFTAWTLPETTEHEYRSPNALAVDEDGESVYVAQTTNDTIAVVETATGRVAREIELPQSPSGLLLEDRTLFVTGASPQGNVYLVEPTTGRVRRGIAAGHMPRSPVLSPDGATLYVLNRFQGIARFIDLATGQTIRCVNLPREPIDAVLTPDGATLIVANHLPVGPATAEHVAAEVSFVDAQSGSIVASIKLANGSTSVRGVCVSPDGRFAFCTHVLARFHNPTTQLIRGWMNTNAFSIIDVARRELYATVLLDDVDRGAANPWAVACSADGKTLAITHAGTHEVSLIDLPALLEKLAGLDDETRAGISEQLSSLIGLRRRIALAGNGPRAALFAGSDLYIAEYFSDSLSVVRPAETKEESDRVRAIALGTDAPLDPVRLGEMYFNDADLCFQNWQSCGSCHPDGRADGLNWDLLNDGFGNAKNTKSMLLAHKTPPAMITGIRASAEVAVRAGVRHIQFAVRPEADLAAIDSYLRSLKPVSSPHLVEGVLSPAAQRGRAAFAKAGCDACHHGPHFTDLESYDLGMGRGQDRGRPMDTPTLIEAWRTAPYLHDGRAPNMRSVLVEHNEEDVHGRISALSEAELEDLLVYLLSL
ncbi:MAG: cell surface protein [Planctomycetota bacterium]|nr:cell surface protein [Planctomycetota bacterium]